MEPGTDGRVGVAGAVDVGAGAAGAHATVTEDAAGSAGYRSESTGYRRHAVVGSPVGDLLLAAEGEALCGLYFTPHTHAPEITTLGPQLKVDRDAFLRRAANELGEYFAGERTGFDIPTATAGDAFSTAVWRLLREIPYGSTRTYGDIAVELGNRNLAQRVGQCVGHNPVSIVVPCHRVVGASGELTGFAGGLDRKRYLLSLEEPPAAEAGRLF